MGQTRELFKPVRSWAGVKESGVTKRADEIRVDTSLNTDVFQTRIGDQSGKVRHAEIKLDNF